MRETVPLGSVPVDETQVVLGARVDAAGMIAGPAVDARKIS